MPSREDILANISTGPGRPSRGKILEGLTVPGGGPLPAPEAKPAGSDRVPLTVGQILPRPEAVQLGLPPEPEPGPFEFAGPLGKFIDLIDTPRAAIVSTLKEAGDLFSGEGFSPTDWWKQTSDNIFMQDVMRDWGLDLPGPLEMVLGLSADIAMDPLTYLLGPAGAAARAGMQAPQVVKALGAGAKYYDDIAEGVTKVAGVSKDTALRKAQVMRDAVEEVGKTNSITSAGREALKEIGMLGEAGLTLPGTGRVGRWLRADRVLDAVSKGRVTAARARQASRLPYIADMARPVAKETLDEAAEAVARFGPGAVEDAAAAVPRIADRVDDIRRGVDLGEDVGENFYTAAARLASRMPVEAVRLPPIVGNALFLALPTYGKARHYVMTRKGAEIIDEAFNTKASIRAGLRSGDYETVLNANKVLMGNNRGWRMRNKFTAKFSKDAIQLRRRARDLGLSDDVVDDMWRTERWLTEELTNAPIVDEAGNLTKNPAFEQKFAHALGVHGDEAVTSFWMEGRRWMDDALTHANALAGGAPWLRKYVDDLWVMRLLRQAPYSPEVARYIRPGEQWHGVRILRQSQHPQGLTDIEQIREIAAAVFGEDAHELFDPSIWKAMDRYLNAIGEQIRRRSMMNYLAGEGVAFKNPMAWSVDEIRTLSADLRQAYGQREATFDQVFRAIEGGLDAEQVKAVRMAAAQADGASAAEVQMAGMAGEMDLLEGRLVEVYQRLREISKEAADRRQSVSEFLEPLVQEAATLGYRRNQIQRSLQALELVRAQQGGTDFGDELLGELYGQFESASEALRVAFEEAQTVAAYDESVQAAQDVIAVLQGKVSAADVASLPEEIQGWAGQVVDILELMDEVPYSALDPFSFDKLPRWMGEVQDDVDAVVGRYREALERAGREGEALDDAVAREIASGAPRAPGVRLANLVEVNGRPWGPDGPAGPSGAPPRDPGPPGAPEAPEGAVRAADEDLGPLTPDEVRRDMDFDVEAEGDVPGLSVRIHVESGARVRSTSLPDVDATYLGDVFVPEAHRGRGIARGMLMEIQADAKETAASRFGSAYGLYLHSRDELLPFYRSLGFEFAPKDDPGWRLVGDDQNLMWWHPEGGAAPGLTRIGDEASSVSALPQTADEVGGVQPRDFHPSDPRITVPLGATFVQADARLAELNEKLTEVADELGRIRDDGSLDLTDLPPRAQGLLDEMDAWEQWLGEHGPTQLGPKGRPSSAMQSVDEFLGEGADVVPMARPARRKVIAACTGKKCATGGGTVAARDLYTGQTFQYMRNAIEESDADLGVIISAKHGVLDPSEMVGAYDATLPKTGASEIVEGPEQLRKFADLVGDAEEVFFYGSKAYRSLMHDLLRRAQQRGMLSADIRVVEASGGVGEIKQSLGRWVDEAADAAPTPGAAAVADDVNAEQIVADAQDLWDSRPPARTKAEKEFDELADDLVRQFLDDPSVMPSVRTAEELVLEVERRAAEGAGLAAAEAPTRETLVEAASTLKWKAPPKGKAAFTDEAQPKFKTSLPTEAELKAQPTSGAGRLLPDYLSTGEEVWPDWLPESFRNTNLDERQAMRRAEWRKQVEEGGHVGRRKPRRVAGAPPARQQRTAITVGAKTPDGRQLMDVWTIEKGDGGRWWVSLNGTPQVVLTGKRENAEAVAQLMYEAWQGRRGVRVLPEVGEMLDVAQEYSKRTAGALADAPPTGKPRSLGAAAADPPSAEAQKILDALDDVETELAATRDVEERLLLVQRRMDLEIESQLLADQEARAARAAGSQTVGESLPAAPTWRPAGGHKKGDVYELAAGREGKPLPVKVRHWSGVVDMEFQVRKSKGKRGGWMVWYRKVGDTKWQRKPDGGNLRAPSPSNPDRMTAVPGGYVTKEDALFAVGDGQVFELVDGPLAAMPPSGAKKPAGPIARALDDPLDPPTPPKTVDEVAEPAATPEPPVPPRDPSKPVNDPSSVVIRTPFGDFKLEVLGRNRKKMTVTASPAGVMKGPKNLKVGKGSTVANVDEALEKIERWATEINMRRRLPLKALQNQGADPRVRHALAQIAGKTEVTGFRGFEGQTWADGPMTQVESDVLYQAEALHELGEADALYKMAARALEDGLEDDATILAMEARRRQVSAEMHRMTKTSHPENAVTLFQEALRAFDDKRTRNGFQSAMTEAYAAQWGPNSQVHRWSDGWMAAGSSDQQAALFEMLNKLFHVENVPSILDDYLKWYDKFLNYWKAQAVATPGFVMRNGFGGGWMSYAFGGMDLGSTNAFAGIYFRALRKGGEEGVLKGVDDMIEELVASPKTKISVGFGARVDINDLRAARRVLDSGIVGGGQVVTEVDRAVASHLVKEFKTPWTGNPADIVFNPFSAEFAPFRAVRSANEQMETVMRGSLAFDMLRKGGSLDEAAGQVYRLHFNYADLTPRERKARRIIPFWTWQKNVVPVLVESLGKHPAAWGRLQQVKGNVELQSKQEGVVPDYFIEGMGIRLPWKVNSFQAYWLPDLPFRDLNRLMKEPSSITRVIAESAAPPVRLPLEIWAGKQFFADLPFSGRYQQVPPVYEKFPFLMEALKAAGKAKKSSKDRWVMRDQDLYLLDGWSPFLARFRRLMPNERRYSRRVASTVVSSVFGTQVRIVDPFETRNQWLRDNKKFDEKMRDIIDIELRVR